MIGLDTRENGLFLQVETRPIKATNNTLLRTVQYMT